MFRDSYDILFHFFCRHDKKDVTHNIVLIETSILGLSSSICGHTRIDLDCEHPDNCYLQFSIKLVQTDIIFNIQQGKHLKCVVLLALRTHKVHNVLACIYHK